MHEWFDQLFKWMAQFSHPAKINEFLKDYQPLLKLLYCGILVPTAIFIWKWLTRWRDLRMLRRRVGSDLYTREDILRATRFFLEPDCQSVDPSGYEDFRKVVSTRQPAFEALDNLLRSESYEKYTLILGDSGMGKTTLLLNYYARHSKMRNPPFRLALVPLGRRDPESLICSLKDRTETVLLLDALDEDTQAIQDHKKRLSAILQQIEGFRHVVITCRTQFFAKTDEIPRETGLVRIGLTAAGQTKHYTLHKLYLSPFSSKQVDAYLKLRFSIWRPWRRRKARSISSKIPDLTVRPMLLAHIQDLLGSDRDFRFSVQIYEEMIRAWLIREEPLVDPVNLRIFSEHLAVDIFTKREERGSEKIPPAEALRLTDQSGIKLSEEQLRGRSLLNRDAEGNLKFAHRAIMEYLFALKFNQDANPAQCPVWTDQIKRFWWELIVCMYQGIGPEGEPAAPLAKVQSLIDRALTLGDLTGLESLSLPRMVSLSTAKNEHFDDRTLKVFCERYTKLAPLTGRVTKQIPELSRQIEVPDPGFQGRSTSVVVDFVTGLMWESSGSHPIAFDEAIELAEKAVVRPIGGLGGWRIPSLQEALSLLPNSVKTQVSDYREVSGASRFGYENLLWTTDSVSDQSNHVACVLNDEKIAYAAGEACLRLVRTIERRMSR